MGITEKIRKRIFIFLFIPILVVIPFFTDDLILKIISGFILLVYSGFIIFLRDSLKSNLIETDIDLQSSLFEEDNANELDKYETDAGEDFKIISQTKNIEVITADNFSLGINRGNKDFFKPS